MNNIDISTDQEVIEFELIPAGAKGEPGTDGITPTVGENGNWFNGEVDTGKPSTGEQGIPGKDGYTPIKGIDYFDGKDGTNGVDGKDGYTPVRGTDYWTENDKQEIVNDVLSSLPIAEEVSY